MFVLLYSQDPLHVEFYIKKKEVNLNGVQLMSYKCRLGSNALEGMHCLHKS